MDGNASEAVRCPPVLIIGFKRPSTLGPVFNRVREAKPSRLYLVLNRAREERPDEVAAVDACKKIFEGVDWPCDVKRKYSSEYTECRTQIERAVTWFFDNEEEGIVLEDDCLPDLSFFRYCGELLERYRNDGRIGMICGHQEHLHMRKLKSYGCSYYFDRFVTIWGWAGWRRAWRMHDLTMAYVPKLLNEFDRMSCLIPNKRFRKRRKLNIELNSKHMTGSWDGAWHISLQTNGLLCIHPFRNLISNLGVGKSSHAERSGRASGAFVKLTKSPWDSAPTVSMDFPLVHPTAIVPYVESERWAFRDVFRYLGPFDALGEFLVRNVKRVLKAVVLLLLRMRGK